MTDRDPSTIDPNHNPEDLRLDDWPHRRSDPTCCEGEGTHAECGGVVHVQNMYGSRMAVCGKCETYELPPEAVEGRVEPKKEE